MKQGYLFLFFFGLFGMAQAQVCDIDPTFQDSTAGVYPRPYNPGVTVDGGIKDTACVNEGYRTQLIIIADTLTLNGSPIALDSIKVNSVTGLPAGLSYTCADANCVFRTGDVECVVIEGTVGAAVVPGEYAISVSGILYFAGTSLPLAFPSPFIPELNGVYAVWVNEEGDPNCTVVSSTRESIITQFTAYPNPVETVLNFEFTTKEAAEFSFNVFSLDGKLMDTAQLSTPTGLVDYQYSTADLPKGIYFYQFQTNGSVHSGKFVK